MASRLQAELQSIAFEMGYDPTCLKVTRDLPVEGDYRYRVLLRYDASKCPSLEGVCEYLGEDLVHAREQLPVVLARHNGSLPKLPLAVRAEAPPPADDAALPEPPRTRRRGPQVLPSSTEWRQYVTILKARASRGEATAALALAKLQAQFGGNEPWAPPSRRKPKEPKP